MNQDQIEMEQKKEYLRGYEKAKRQMERSELKIREMRLNRICPPYLVKSFFLIFQGIFDFISQMNEPKGWTFLCIWYENRRF